MEAPDIGPIVDRVRRNGIVLAVACDARNGLARPDHDLQYRARWQTIWRLNGTTASNRQPKAVEATADNYTEVVRHESFTE